MDDVLALTVLGAIVLVVLVWGGIRLLWAGRQLDELTPTGSTRIPVAPSGSVAAKVDRRLQMTRAALETLVMPEVDQEELHPSPGAFATAPRPIWSSGPVFSVWLPPWRSVSCCCLRLGLGTAFVPRVGSGPWRSAPAGLRPRPTNPGPELNPRPYRSPPGTQRTSPCSRFA